MCTCGGKMFHALKGLAASWRAALFGSLAEPAHRGKSLPTHFVAKRLDPPGRSGQKPARQPREGEAGPGNNALYLHVLARSSPALRTLRPTRRPVGNAARPHHLSNEFFAALFRNGFDRLGEQVMLSRHVHLPSIASKKWLYCGWVRSYCYCVTAALSLRKEKAPWLRANFVA
jgi:hypothetical protein